MTVYLKLKNFRKLKLSRIFSEDLTKGVVSLNWNFEEKKTNENFEAKRNGFSSEAV